ncbi:septal ring lytic transglycosylase RlpA family protein [Bradyrhizobium sp. dw_411]|uniref:septal ring lytic transglycosylase RlpA family protein n=1 Tax=Bradyrhizobium sp. dw_411 TaxID=2720082 RepID=UPI001BCD48A4|nr:septal ring lytic transglycosylase RlpA family protein [Bradyrhizobium sp. dw_411]
MVTSKIQALGNAFRFRVALTFFAALALMGGNVSEASARTRHHHYSHHHFHHHASNASRTDSSWRDANASIASSGGRTFSGMASFYGNESGSKTASGQRFNQNAMTCAHRSLPFGTRLKVTHGDRSVVVTVNDRGPFVRGRVLDLSTGAARAVGLTGAGVGRVVAEVL